MAEFLEGSHLSPGAGEYGDAPQVIFGYSLMSLDLWQFLKHSQNSLSQFEWIEDLAEPWRSHPEPPGKLPYAQAGCGGRAKQVQLTAVGFFLIEDLSTVDSRSSSWRTASESLGFLRSCGARTEILLRAATTSTKGS